MVIQKQALSSAVTCKEVHIKSFRIFNLWNISSGPEKILFLWLHCTVSLHLVVMHHGSHRGIMKVTQLHMLNGPHDVEATGKPIPRWHLPLAVNSIEISWLPSSTTDLDIIVIVCIQVQVLVCGSGAVTFLLQLNQRYKLRLLTVKEATASMQPRSGQKTRWNKRRNVSTPTKDHLSVADETPEWARGGSPATLAAAAAAACWG